jgi:hypothetical protein
MFGTNPNVGFLNPVVAAKAGAPVQKTSTVNAGKGLGISGAIPSSAAGGNLKEQARGQKSRLVNQ